MKRNAAVVLVFLFLLGVTLPCLAADPPPPNPPVDAPKTKLPSLLGKWKGKVNVVNEKGYSSFTMVLKITDQSEARDLFRGYVSDEAGTWHFITGSHNIDNTLMLVSQSQIWNATMWWEGPVPTIGITAGHDDIPTVISGALSKTSE